jgi:hypothetical protein
MTASDPSEPIHLTPEQRVEEIGQILASAVLRLRHRNALASPSPDPDPAENSLQNSLDDAPRITAHEHTS